jgi:hypothetical protein
MMDNFNTPLAFWGFSMVDATEPWVSVRASFAPSSSTGTSDGFFLLPSSLASGSMGGGKLGSSLGLVYVGGITQMCGGVIQNLEQKRFCCKPAGACSTKGHKAKLVGLSTKTLYVKHTQNGHARLEPNPLVYLLPADVTVAELLGQENLLEVWVAYFDSLHAEVAGATLHSSSLSTGTSSPCWEEVELSTKASNSFKTPKKLRLGDVLNLDTIPVTCHRGGEILTTMVTQDIDDEEVAERSKVEHALQIIMSDWNKLNTNFQMIYIEFDTAGCSKTKVSQHDLGYTG